MKCAVCSNSDYRKIMTFRKDDMDLIQCSKCELVSLKPLVKVGGIDDYETIDIEGYYEYLKKTRLRQYTKDLKIISGFHKKGFLLDIGSSYGLFLSLAQSQGYKVMGIEPSRAAVDYCKKLYPTLPIKEGELENVCFKDNKFDVVTMWSVLEHTVEPDREIKQIKGLLNNDALLCLRVPLFNSLLPKIIIIISKLSFGLIDSPARALYQIDYRYKHFYHFNLNNLSLLLKNNGFSVVDYYKENSIRSDCLEERLLLDVQFSSNWSKGIIVKKIILKIVFILADIFNAQDELVLFCKNKEVQQGGV